MFCRRRMFLPSSLLAYAYGMDCGNFPIIHLLRIPVESRERNLARIRPASQLVVGWGREDSTLVYICMYSTRLQLRLPGWFQNKIFSVHHDTHTHLLMAHIYSCQLELPVIKITNGGLSEFGASLDLTAGQFSLCHFDRPTSIPSKTVPVDGWMDGRTDGGPPTQTRTHCTALAVVVGGTQQLIKLPSRKKLSSIFVGRRAAAASLL